MSIVVVVVVDVVGVVVVVVVDVDVVVDVVGVVVGVFIIDLSVVFVDEPVQFVSYQTFLAVPTDFEQVHVIKTSFEKKIINGDHC